MSQHHCSSCGAPLPAGKPGEVVRCPFCGAEERLVGPGSGAAPAAGGGARVTLALVGCAMAGVAVPAVFGVVIAVSLGGRPTPASSPSHPRVVRRASSRPSPRPAPAPAGVRPSELSGRGAGVGWFRLDAPGMKGSTDDFDFLGNLDWMLGIARNWSTDARIERGFLDGVRADGSLDVSAREDRDVDLRFYSPTLREMARKGSEVSEQHVASEFRIEISKGHLEGYIDEESGLEDDPDPPEPSLKCPLPKLMAAWKARGMPPRPTYQLALQWIQLDGPGHWRWTVDGEPDFGRHVELPPLSPETCHTLRF